MAELSVRLTADIANIERALKKVRGDLAGVGDSAERTQKQLVRGSRGIASVGKSAANAAPTVQEFSRIIQDAPFGIQGVANNVQQLTANFGNLSRSAGGAIPALKAMVASLSGPAGILLAVSLVTVGLQVFGDKLFSSKNKVDQLKKSLERLNDTFDAELNLNKQLQKNLEIQELSTVNILTSRREILQRQLASVGAILTENQALLTQIKIQNELVSDWELILQLVTRVAGTVALSLTKAYEDTKKIGDALRKPFEDLLGLEIDRSKFSSASKKDKEKEQELVNENLRIQTQLQSIVGQILQVNKDITKEQEKQNALTGPRISFTPGNLGEIFKVTQGIGPALVKPITLAVREVKPKLDEFTEQLRAFNESANQIIQGEITNTFSFLGEAIGAGIASGQTVFESLGKGLLASMGQFLSSMGDLLIKYGTLAIAKGKIDAAIAAGGPIAIGAGLAAIAVGVAVKAAGSALGRAATKGFGSGFGTGAVAGQGGFSSVGGASFGVSGSGQQTVVFEIAGTKLLGVLRNTQERNTRLGGSQF